jgi:hypothetical protein
LFSRQIATIIHQRGAQVILSGVVLCMLAINGLAGYYKEREVHAGERAAGGKIPSVRTRHVQNRAALALSIAAHTLHHNQSFLGHYYRRMRARLSAPKVISATAHKLARVLYHPIITGQPYQESIFAERETQHQQRTFISLHARHALSAINSSP